MSIEKISASPNQAAVKELERKAVELSQILRRLPAANYATLKLIISHLGRVADHAQFNMMGPKNLGTVFGPTLMRAGEDKVICLKFSSRYVLFSQQNILRIKWALIKMAEVVANNTLKTH